MSDPSPRPAVARRLALAAAVVLALIAPVRTFRELPRLVRLLPAQEYHLPGGPWFKAARPGVTLEPYSLRAVVLGRSFSASLPRPVREYPQTVQFSQPDESLELEWRFLGFLPVGSLRLEAVPELSVLPGGQAIGVVMSGHGLLVSRTAPVTDVSGRRRFPAREADIRPGDVIAEVNGEAVRSPMDVARIVQETGRRGARLAMVIERDGRRFRTFIDPVPVFDERTGFQRYLLGLFLQDPVAGVGTLTFFHPVTRQYGALGHGVTAAGQELSAVVNGQIVAATIQGIQRSARGRPGEKIGSFDYRARRLGTIEKNNEYGIFGRLEMDPPGSQGTRPVPVALAHQVEPGPAVIRTVLEGDKVESFAVEIVRVLPRGRRDGRGMVVKIVDPRLLQRTEGIVQGMSGSPILQNGRLVGAITHVFVNDPSRGYGVMAEWMVYEAGLIPRTDGELTGDGLMEDEGEEALPKAG